MSGGASGLGSVSYIFQSHFDESQCANVWIVMDNIMNSKCRKCKGSRGVGGL